MLTMDWKKERLGFLLKEIKQDLELLEKYKWEAENKRDHHWHMWQKDDSDRSVIENFNYWDGQKTAYQVAIRKNEKHIRMLEDLLNHFDE